MKNIEILLEAMNDWEGKNGEDCVEYCGYRDAINFAHFLQTIGLTFTEGQLRECENPIMAYYDVVDQLVKSFDDENKILTDLQQRLPDVDLSEYYIGLDAKLTAYYWANSDLKSEEDFQEFINSFEEESK